MLLLETWVAGVADAMIKASCCPPGTPPFPQHVWITPRRKHAHWRRDNHGGMPRPRPGAALVVPASLWQHAVANRPGFAQAVAKVHLSAQPPADRSVQPLIQRHCWTAPASCWAARHCSGPPGEGTRARTDAAPVPPPPPPRGHTRKAPAPLRSARATASSPPHPPRGGGFAARCAPGCSSMSLLLAWLCAAGHRGRTRAPLP